MGNDGFVAARLARAAEAVAGRPVARPLPSPARNAEPPRATRLPRLGRMWLAVAVLVDHAAVLASQQVDHTAQHACFGLGLRVGVRLRGLGRGEG